MSDEQANTLGKITPGIYQMHCDAEAEITKIDGDNVIGNICGFPSSQHVWDLDGSLSGIPECDLVKRIGDLNCKSDPAYSGCRMLTEDCDCHYCQSDEEEEVKEELLKYIKIASKKNRKKLIADIKKKRKHEDFAAHLERASKVVASWPEWKRKAMGLTRTSHLADTPIPKEIRMPNEKVLPEWAVCYALCPRGDWYWFSIVPKVIGDNWGGFSFFYKGMIPKEYAPKEVPKDWKKSLMMIKKPEILFKDPIDEEEEKEAFEKFKGENDER